MTTSSSSLPKVALIGTGGTIAGVAPTPLEQISYQAGVLTVDRMLETLPGIEGVARITSVQCGNLRCQAGLGGASTQADETPGPASAV